MKHNLVFLCILFLFTGCATLYSPQEKSALLRQQTAWWNNLRLTGILEANYQGFQFRKDAVLDCAPAALTLTIVDAGLFGMKPEPFLVARLTPQFCTVTNSGSTHILTHEQYIQMIPDVQYLLNPQQILEYENAILRGGTFQTASAIYHFDSQMRLTGIQAKETKTNIDFTWGSTLQKITILRDGDVLASLKIDTINKR